MLFDSLAAVAVAHALEPLIGSRVQLVVQISQLTAGLELYAGERWYLTVSADPEREGVGLSRERFRRGAATPSQLHLTLKSRLEGSRLTGVHVPEFERIVYLDFHGAEDSRLVVEAMGRMANLVATDANGEIRAVARRVTPAMSTFRTLLPGELYAPPPPQSKAAPTTVEAEDLSPLPEDHDEAARAVVREVRGMSPLAAREVVYRAAAVGRESRGPEDRSTAGAFDAGHLATAIRELYMSVLEGAAEPSIVRRDGEVIAYAAYPITHLAHDLERVASIGEAIEAFEAERLGADPYRRAREATAGRLAKALEREERRLAALRRETKDTLEIEQLRQKGDLILAHRSRLEQGARDFSAQYEPDGEPLRIELDPSLSAAENAQSYFNRYKKARRAAKALPERIAAAETDVEALRQLEYDLATAEDRSAIDAVHDNLIALGYGESTARRRTAGTPPGPQRVVSPDNFVIWVGRNSRQNEVVTFDKGVRGDLWLHARGVPGGHVVIKAAGRSIPEALVRAAGAIAAWQSASRAELHVEVTVADIRHVKRVAGGAPGLVRVAESSTITVQPLSATDIWPPDPSA